MLKQLRNADCGMKTKQIDDCRLTNDDCGFQMRNEKHNIGISNIYFSQTKVCGYLSPFTLYLSPY